MPPSSLHLHDAPSTRVMQPQVALLGHSRSQLQAFAASSQYQPIGHRLPAHMPHVPSSQLGPLGASGSASSFAAPLSSASVSASSPSAA